jgi:hypothetical protein
MATGKYRSGSTYTTDTKNRIIRYVYMHPGSKGSEIAKALGLERRRVNSFLWHEGRSLYGLTYSGYRYFPQSSMPSKAKPSTTQSHPAPIGIGEWDTGLCQRLSRMDQTSAQLKIRQMSIQTIEQAFTEESYPGLSDELKVELAMRRAELLGRQPQPVEPHHGYNLAKQIVFWMGVSLVVWVISVANQRPSNTPQLSDPPAIQPQ